MKIMKRVAMTVMALMLAAGAASADTLSLNGTVEAGVTVPVYAPIGGTVDTVSVEQGMRVSAGENLFSYRTEKTYASEDGTVAGVFAKAGDDAEKVTEKYGADLYIEGTTIYSVSASISKAYNAAETTIVHTGETVYLVCRTDAKRFGTGVITAVDGSNYTVLVTEGSAVCLEGFASSVEGEHLRIQAEIAEAYRAAGVNVPVNDDLYRKYRDKKLVKQILADLQKQGVLVKVNRDYYMGKEAWDRALQVLQDRINAEGQITLAEFRDLLNTSRKYSQMLLEAYDDRKYTKLEGEAGDPVRRLTGKLQKMGGD